jgi:hypothetical protein
MSDFFPAGITQDDMNRKLDQLIDPDDNYQELSYQQQSQQSQQNAAASPSTSSVGGSSISSAGAASLPNHPSNPAISGSAEINSVNSFSDMNSATSNSNPRMFDPSANPYYPHASAVANSNQFNDFASAFPSALSANDSYASILAQQQQAVALETDPNQLDFNSLSLSTNPQHGGYLASSNYTGLSAQLSTNAVLSQAASASAAPAATSTLFVGDISVYCIEDDLLDLFRRFGTILAASFKRTANKNASNMTTINTMYGGASANIVQGNLRYGFIRYQTTEEAQQAMKELNGFILKGRALRYVPRLKILIAIFETNFHFL